MFKLPHNCTHFTPYQGHTQNPPIYALTTHKPRISRCTSWIYKRKINQRSNCQHLLDHRKSKRIEKKKKKENIYFCFIGYAKAFDCVNHNKLWKILKEIRIPDHLICLLRNLYAVQEATVRTYMEQQTGSKTGKEYIKAVTLLI